MKGKRLQVKLVSSSEDINSSDRRALKSGLEQFVKKLDALHGDREEGLSIKENRELSNISIELHKFQSKLK